jgi:hypothetical protein
MRRKLLILAVAAALVSILAAPPSAEAAKTCSDEAVSARGEPAKFMWLAKTKARANWRRKVRATPGLGTGFSNWGDAETSEERCLTSEDGTVCIFTGYPCRP